MRSDRLNAMKGQDGGCREGHKTGGRLGHMSSGHKHLHLCLIMNRTGFCNKPTLFK